MTTMKKYFFKVALAVILAAAIVATFLLAQKEKPRGIVEEAATSARRGMEWLLGYDENLNDPGILWAVNEMNKNYCGSNELENFVFERFGEFENHPVDAAYKKLITGSGGEKPSDETIKMSGKKYDAELLDALYCNDNGAEKWASENGPEWLKTPENKGFSGYDLTHKFLAIIIAKNNGCAKTEEINLQLDKLAAQIVNEENNSAFNDLFAERVALLEYARHKEGVEKRWIETIIKKQNKSGSWNNSVLFGTPDDPHTTALATWALAQYSESCPL